MGLTEPCSEIQITTRHSLNLSHVPGLLPPAVFPYLKLLLQLIMFTEKENHNQYHSEKFYLLRSFEFWISLRNAGGAVTLGKLYVIYMCMKMHVCTSVYDTFIQICAYLDIYVYAPYCFIS